MRTSRCLTIVCTALACCLTFKAAAAEQASPGAPSPLDGVKFDTSTVVGTDGFFRVGKSTTGRWWLMDENGKPFFYRGVTSINRSGRAGGRLAEDGPYAAVVDRKYNYQKDPTAFAESVIARLREWNFNAMGAWASEDLFDRGMPYTEITEFAKVGPSIATRGITLPDVFDPAWEKAIDELAQKICTPRKNSRQLVGYFTDNEMGWAQWREEDIADQAGAGPARASVRPTLLQACLSRPSTESAGQAARKLILDKYGKDPAALARAWEIPAEFARDPDPVRAMTNRGIGLGSKGYIVDQTAFSHLFARRYFELSSNAIRKYDPNHLILGCRFGAPPGSVVLAECRRPFVDVVSANNYRENMYERMEIYHKPNDMPVLVGEFAWYSSTFVNGKNSDGMVAKGTVSLEKLFTHPGVVGYTWYRWVNKSTPDGFAQKNPGKQFIGDGLVTLDDETNHLHADPLTKINERAEDIAVGKIKPGN